MANTEEHDGPLETFSQFYPVELSGATVYAPSEVATYVRLDSFGVAGSSLSIVGGNAALQDSDPSTYMQWQLPVPLLSSFGQNEDFGFDVTFPPAASLPDDAFALFLGGRAHRVPQSNGFFNGSQARIILRLVADHTALPAVYAQMTWTTYEDYDGQLRGQALHVGPASMSSQTNLRNALLAGAIWRYRVISLSGGSGGYEYSNKVIQMRMAIGAAAAAPQITGGQRMSRRTFYL